MITQKIRKKERGQRKCQEKYTY